MLELALHILDLFENAARAGATLIELQIARRQNGDLLIRIDDNGSGMDCAAETIVDPFFTTKAEKKTGLGISLFRAAAERADGALDLDRSPLGGLCVSVRMGYSHIDRQPLGDLAATLAGHLLTNPEITLRCHLETPENQILLDSARLAQESPESSLLVRSRKFAQHVREAQALLQIY